MAQIIVNADDFGLHESVNEGIIIGHNRGIITSTTLLANGPAFDDAVAKAKAHPSLGVGIHIGLVGGLDPVSDPQDVPSLLVDGKLPASYEEFMKRLYTKQIQGRELYLEIRNQVEKVMNTGLTITHVDGHQHMHVLPAVVNLLSPIMKEFGLHKIRIPDEKITLRNGVGSMKRWASKVALSTVASKAYDTTRDFGFSSPLYFWGMINGGDLHRQALLGVLEAIKGSTGVHEIMCHPGASNAILSEQFDWGYHWEEELSALTDPFMKEFIDGYGMELIHYGQFSYGGNQ